MADCLATLMTSTGETSNVMPGPQDVGTATLVVYPFSMWGWKLTFDAYEWPSGHQIH